MEGGGNPTGPQGESPTAAVESPGVVPEVVTPDEISGGSAPRAKKVPGKPFAKGQSGNVAGRPRRLRHMDDFLREIPQLPPLPKDAPPEVRAKRAEDAASMVRPDGQPMDRFDAFMAILWRVAMDPNHRNWDDAAKYILVYRLGKPRERIELGLPEPGSGGGSADEPIDVTPHVGGKTTGEMRRRMEELDAIRAQHQKRITSVK